MVTHTQHIIHRHLEVYFSIEKVAMRIYRVQHSFHNCAPVPEWVEQYNNEWYYKNRAKAQQVAFNLAKRLSKLDHAVAVAKVEKEKDDIKREQAWLKSEDNKGHVSYNYIQQKLEKRIAKLDRTIYGLMAGHTIIRRKNNKGQYSWRFNKVQVNEIAVDESDIDENESESESECESESVCNSN